VTWRSQVDPLITHRRGTRDGTLWTTSSTLQLLPSFISQGRINPYCGLMEWTSTIDALPTTGVVGTVLHKRIAHLYGHFFLVTHIFWWCCVGLEVYSSRIYFSGGGALDWRFTMPVVVHFSMVRRADKKRAQCKGATHLPLHQTSYQSRAEPQRSWGTCAFRPPVYEHYGRKTTSHF